MENLLLSSKDQLAQLDTSYIRYLRDKIDWSDRLIGIVGARGTGKTTLLLQHLQQQYGFSEEAIYISLDDIYFTENSLMEFIKNFRVRGGCYFYFDEVHKYPNWAREIKNAYDQFKDIQIVFTGSSIIDILKQNVDLSRRASMYELPGLSFREFLSISGIKNLEKFSLSDIVAHHSELSMQLTKDFRPLKYFRDYLNYGYYPFFLENVSSFHRKLKQVVNLVIGTDINFIDGYDPKNARKVLHLLYLLAANVPFKPNISRLSEKIGVHRNTLIHYLHYLEKASIIHMINGQGISVSALQKPEKIFLRNTNLSYALSPAECNIGTLRETFFVSQIEPVYSLSIPLKGDFFVDEKYTFEVGNKSKTTKQIKEVKDAFVVSDDMERGIGNKIPLWLFGLLY